MLPPGPTTEGWWFTPLAALLLLGLDAGALPSHPSAMAPPYEAPGRWIADRRGDGRGVRVSAHEEAGFLVLSTWKADVCVGTVRLLPDEAADLVAGVAEALGRLASRDQPDHGSAAPDVRVAASEERLRRPRP